MEREAVKPPEACTSLADIRTEIDRIDEQIIRLIGQRARYVRVAAQFKTTQAHVRDEARVQAMLVPRREWATAAHLDPDMIERLYRMLVDYFIQEETTHWNTLKQP